MPTVTHPRIPTLQFQVSDADLDRWLAQGWLADQPAPPEPAPAPVDVTPASDSDPAPTPSPRRPRRTKKEN